MVQPGSSFSVPVTGTREPRPWAQVQRMFSCSCGTSHGPRSGGSLRGDPTELTSSRLYTDLGPTRHRVVHWVLLDRVTHLSQPRPPLPSLVFLSWTDTGTGGGVNLAKHWVLMKGDSSHRPSETDDLFWVTSLCGGRLSV